MLSAILICATVNGIAIWLPHNKDIQGLPVTIEEKLRFTIGNVIALIAIGTIAWMS